MLMLKKRDLLIATVLSVVLTSGSCKETADSDESLRYMVMGDAARVAAEKLGGRVVKKLPRQGIYAIEFSDKSNVEAMMTKSLEKDFKIEKDQKRFAIGAMLDDRRLAEEIPWGISRTYEKNGVADIPDLSYYPNAGDVVYPVCVIDSGYDIAHPDLPNDASNADPSQANSFSQDTCAHGTHCAGTIGAIGNNNEGVVGVWPGAPKMKIVKVFDGNECNWIYSSGLIAAVEECYNSGARITSMSLGGSFYSSFEDDAFRNMYENNGMLHVAAAGNYGDSSYSYPASYDSVMSVAATDVNNNKASFSQFNDQVDIAAPGVNVRSTTPGNSYANWQGTSMACPHVAGAALVLWNTYPTVSNVNIRYALTSGAIDLGSQGYDNSFGHGLLNYWNAVEALGGTFSPSMAPVPCTGESLTIAVTTDAYPQETTWTVKDDEGNLFFSNGYLPGGTTTTTTECLSPDCFTFEITDSYGDGICCGYGTGSYTVTLDGTEILSGGAFGTSDSVDFCINEPAPIASPTVSPTTISTISPPTTDMCIPAGSDCFIKHSGTGCDDLSCKDKVCDERDKCCSKKWNDKCSDKAEELCTPVCACVEDIDGSFLLKMKDSGPVTKTCDWLKDQSAEKRDNVCKKTHSHGDIQAARLVCPITCELEGCSGN